MTIKKFRQQKIVQELPLTLITTSIVILLVIISRPNQNSLRRLYALSRLELDALTFFILSVNC